MQETRYWFSGREVEEQRGAGGKKGRGVGHAWVGQEVCNLEEDVKNN